MLSIDLNADLGEHPATNLDEQIMPYLSSCNIACGGHIGDASSVRNTVLIAKSNSVAVGAHPSYPDRKNFGRKVMQIQPQELADSLQEQISLVKRICEEEGVSLHHVKPHGALYNHAAANTFMSQLILEVLQDTCPNVPWMGFAHSLSQEVAEKANYPFIAEGFADRRYESDGTLRSRSLPGAVLEPAEVLGQVEELVLRKRVKADEWMPLSVQSICLHGDTAGAISLAKQIHDHLVDKGIHIAAV
ncbi:MAG: 5-oxoprolinase subunit PxpA [Ekhidna sp.]